MEKINNKDFLEYLKKNSIQNMNSIKTITFNKKSISIKIMDKNFFLNSIFNEKSLYNLILAYLSNYIKENEKNKPYDMDFLKYKYQKIIIREC